MKFDTHTHTYYSLCAKTTPQELVEAAEEHLDAVVVCDHNEIEGAMEARRKCIEQSRKLVVELGIELSTEFGEIGAKFLSEEECHLFMAIRCGGKFEFTDAYKMIRELRVNPTSDMMIDLHHPFDYANPKRGFNFRGVIEAGIFKDMGELMRFFDFTEMNAASTSIKETQAALALAEEHNKPIVCSSDSHYPDQIGRYYTESPEDDIVHAILSGDLKRPPPEAIDYALSRRYRIRSWGRKRIRKIFG